MSPPAQSKLQGVGSFRAYILLNSEVTQFSCIIFYNVVYVHAVDLIDKKLFICNLSYKKSSNYIIKYVVPCNTLSHFAFFSLDENILLLFYLLLLFVQRPTLMYDGLHDRPLKHYFNKPEHRVTLTKLTLVRKW